MGSESANLAAGCPPYRRVFFSAGEQYKGGKQRQVNSCLGEVTVSQKQGKRLGLKAKRQLSPALEKCCLRLCAQGSFQQAEQNVETVMGLKVGHSSLHRLVQKEELPVTQRSCPAEAVSIDGGKVRVRCEATGRGEWRDYKAVRLHQGECAAFFPSARSVAAME